jgi:hypothetical protein
MTARGPKTRLAAISALAALIGAAALLALAASPAPASATVARGIADPTLTQPGEKLDPTVQAKELKQMSIGLHAKYVRFVVSWAAAEPDQAGVYDESYLASVGSAVSLAQADGMKVILTFAYVPQWASDSRWWTDNPYPVKGYNSRYAMKTDAVTLDAFQAFIAHIATAFPGVWGYEVWNEPNLQITLYPQATAEDANYGTVDDPNYGVDVYVDMLRRVSAAVRQNAPAAQVIAGATASRGSRATDPLIDREKMTSPQQFASQLKAAGVSDLFDAYSHHPYTPGATAHPWPEAAPAHPSYTVALQNLNVLTSIFPTKPFYITEYGYQTTACASFTGQFVSLATQADYLTRAYAYVKRFPQVKLLMWFLLDDFSPSGLPLDYNGCYTGLCDIAGVKKPSWYAFAGDTTLTLAGPTSAPSRRSVTLSGILKSSTDGLLAGKTLTVQAHAAGKPWAKVVSVKTNQHGVYSFTANASVTKTYRVMWTGVVTSSTRRLART